MIISYSHTSKNHPNAKWIFKLAFHYTGTKNNEQDFFFFLLRRGRPAWDDLWVRSGLRSATLMLQEMYVATVTSPTGLWSLSWRFSVFQYFTSYKKASRCVIKPITWHLHYQNGHYSICRKLCFNFLYIEAGEEENEQNRRTSGSALKICSWNFYSSFWMYSPLPWRLLGVNICVFPMPEGLISKTSDWKKKKSLGNSF